MENIERHILYELINNDLDIRLDPPDYKYLSQEFKTQYNLLHRMKTSQYDINQTNLEVYAISLGIDIDLNYPLQNEKLIDKNLIDILRVQTQFKTRQDEISHLDIYLEQYKQGDDNARKEIIKTLSKSQATKSSVKSISEFYDEEALFFRNIVDKVPLDGLVFWGNGKENTRQFLGLSNILKRIAPTDLVVIGARPSVGKTSFALAMMNALYKNHYKPLFISLEMTNGELIRRLATSKSGMSNDRIFNPMTEFGPDEIALYEASLLEVKNMDIKLIDEPPSSWLEMKALIIEHVDEIDYVIIDHLHIISSFDGKSNDNKNNMYADITRDMKEFCRVYKKPIIVLAQLSREVRGSTGKHRDPSYVKPNMTDLRASGSIEQDANTIIMMHRTMPTGSKEYVKKELENHIKYGSYPITLSIEKNRSGGLGEVEYLFRAKTGRWEEVYKEKESSSTQKNGGYQYGSK